MSEIDALLAQLEAKTQRGSRIWLDTLTLPEPIRTNTLKAWLEDDWAQNPDYFAEVVGIVTLLVQVGTAVAGLAGAVQAVQAIRAAL